MPSLNVYVSEELKNRMSSHDDMNWSQIAATAIATAIDIRERTAMNPQEGTLARLRAQRNGATEKRYAEGVALGIAYASADDAEFEDLEAIAELREREFDDGQEACRAVVYAIYGDNTTGHEYLWFVENVLDRPVGKEPPLALVEGFIAGVGKIVDQV
jgi:hypothetical protein